jgi:CHASE1-domain containing sensor protein
VSRIHTRIAGLTVLAVLLLMAVAGPALASTGEGLAGRTNDKMITFFCFGVIAFFPLLIITLTIIQTRLENRKEQRRSDLERLG